MPRGGRRSGKPGALYPNRSDLAQAVRTAPGQAYGQQARQAEAQKAIPLPAQQPPVPTRTPSPPPEPGLLHAPTTRPNEPVTAGLSVGAGAGPEAMAGQGITGNIDNDLRTLYRLFPVEEIRQIIERNEGLRGLS